MCIDAAASGSVKGAYMTSNCRSESCKIVPGRVVRVGDRPLRVAFVHRTVSRYVQNVHELCQLAQRLETSVGIVDAALLGRSLCASAWLAQETDVLVLVEGSQAGMVSLQRPGSVLIIIYSFKARNPMYKSLAYFAGVHTLELIPLDPELVWPPISGLDECATTSHFACHQLECHFTFHFTSQRIPATVFQGFLAEAIKRVGSPLDEQQRVCAPPLPWPLEPSHPGYFGEPIARQVHASVCACVRSCVRSVRVLVQRHARTIACSGLDTET